MQVCVTLKYLQYSTVFFYCDKRRSFHVQRQSFTQTGYISERLNLIVFLHLAMRKYNESTLAKHPLHWGTGSRNCQHSHCHLFKPRKVFIMDSPKFQTINIIFIRRCLNVAHQLCSDRQAYVSFLFAGFVPVIREEFRHFGRWLLIFIITALSNADWFLGFSHTVI